MGIIELEYRLTADIERVDADAEMFNQPVYVLSFFPSGEGEKKATAVEIDNPKVILSAYKKTTDGNTVMRLYNSSNSDVKTKLLVENESYEVELTPYEVKALKFQNGLVADCDLLGR